MSPITVVTATIPEREPWLRQLEQSLAAQSHQPHEWLVQVDHDRRGPALVINDLVQQADTTYVFRCDDDDLFDPNHFETIVANLYHGDVVWTWPRVDPPGWIGVDGLQVNFPIHMIDQINWITSAAAVHTGLWDYLGGYRDVPNEDHDLWKRAHHDAAARFHCVPQVTWTYRLGDWPHLSDPEAQP